MIERFLDLLAPCADLGLVAYEESAVREPHRTVSAFDAAALRRDLYRLRDLADDLAEHDVTDLVGSWRGSGGSAATAALVAVATRIAAARSALTDLADELAAAAAVVDDVTDRYRSAMNTVCDPELCGVDVDVLAVGLQTGAVSREALRSELGVRLDYADSAGRIATAALHEVTAALDGRAGAGRSPGELVVAGGR